jgi:hypothetical protein
MGRIILYVVVILSVLWSGYAGYDLIINSKTRFAPQFIFHEEDRGVLLIRKVEEIPFGDFIELTTKNPFSKEVESIDALKIGDINYFLSAQRSILLLEKNTHWKISEINKLRKAIKLANINVQFDGVYAVLTKDLSLDLQSEGEIVYTNGDKKASANYWDLTTNNEIARTDVYALSSGYFQYKSSVNTGKYGKPVADSKTFSAVLPQTIEKYEFFERFYALEYDSIFAKNPLASWVDKGYVVAEFNNQTVLVSDYRAQQTPSLVLMEHASNADSINLDDPIKYFRGVKLSSNFPNNTDSSFYLIEIEDKTIFTESVELAKKVQIAYQMGETLGLNQQKSEQLFSGLPSQTNYRKVEQDLKMSITFKKNLKFAVTTAPPGEQLVLTTTSNWTNSELKNYSGLEPIPDHIRGAYSLFTYDQQGNYALLNNNGDVIWKGTADTSLIDQPQVIDIFENDKHQLLFTTHKSVYLIDLNGANVGSFPYRGDYNFTSSVSYFRWKNTTRFLVGNSKGELTMLNTSGSELNIVQASTNPLVKTAFALNVNGNLRGWCVDATNEKLLTYLENPVKTEKLGKSTANYFEKINGEVIGIKEENGHVELEEMRNNASKMLSQGQDIPINSGTAIKKNNTLLIYNKNHELVQSIDLDFNEVLSVFSIRVNQANYILILDYFRNNIHCYGSNGNLLEGFPKEGSALLKASHNESTNELNIYTIISNSVVCHKIKLTKNN